MGAGWPALAQGEPYGPRMIVKQVRSLEGSVADPALADLPLPRDVLSRARTITRRVCQGDRLRLTAVEARTDPLRPPALGYERAPFTGSVVLEILADIPELGWQAGRRVELLHTDLSRFDHPGMAGGAAWSLTLLSTPAAAAATGVMQLDWAPGQTWTLDGGAAQAGGAALDCVETTLHATPDTYLEALLGVEP
jgi:hypothetical protein